jgi:hypothetical protein
MATTTVPHPISRDQVMAKTANNTVVELALRRIFMSAHLPTLVARLGIGLIWEELLAVSEASLGTGFWRMRRTRTK